MSSSWGSGMGLRFVVWVDKISASRAEMQIYLQLPEAQPNFCLRSELKLVQNFG